MTQPLKGSDLLADLVRALEEAVEHDTRCQENPCSSPTAIQGATEARLAARDNLLTALRTPRSEVFREEMVERLRRAGDEMYDALGVAVHQRVDPTAAQIARQHWSEIQGEDLSGGSSDD